MAIEDGVVETWRDRFEQRIKHLIEEKHVRTNERVTDCVKRQDKFQEEVPNVYVSKESLQYQLKNLSDRYDPILTEVVWMRRLILGGFIGALVQYVYTHNK